MYGGVDSIPFHFAYTCLSETVAHPTPPRPPSPPHALCVSSLNCSECLIEHGTKMRCSEHFGALRSIVFRFWHMTSSSMHSGGWLLPAWPRTNSHSLRIIHIWIHITTYTTRVFIYILMCVYFRSVRRARAAVCLHSIYLRLWRRSLTHFIIFCIFSTAVFFFCFSLFNFWIFLSVGWSVPRVPFSSHSFVNFLMGPNG